MPTLVSRPTPLRRAPRPKLRRSTKIVLAIAGSLLLHGLALLILGWVIPHWPRHRPKPALKPLQVEIVPNATPEPSGPADVSAPTPPPYIRTLTDQTADKDPEQPDFQSDHSTNAAAELAASGVKPLPSQEGRELPEFDFDTRPYRPGQEAVDAAASAPVAPPEQAHPPSDETEKPPDAKQPSRTTKTRKSQTSAPAPTPRPDGDLVMMMPNSTPSLEPPAPSPQATPETGDDGPPPPPKPKSHAPQVQMPPAAPANASSAGVPRPPGYQPQSVQTKMNGSINNRGKSAVSAQGTPLGRYEKGVSDAIGMYWYYKAEESAADVSVGTVKLHFYVDRAGRVKEVKFTGGKENGALGLISEEAVNGASIPPMPPDVAATLDGGRLEVEYSFSFY